MKSLLLCVTLLFAHVPLLSTFYNVKFETLNGALIKTSAYQGKKVVIAVVSAKADGSRLVGYLDSVQRNTANLQVIVVPSDDFGGDVRTEQLAVMQNNTSVVMTKPLKVTKASAFLQHPLFVWLTQLQENGHFDMDVEGEGQLFIVSSTGILSAVLSKDTALETIAATINQPLAKQ